MVDQQSPETPSGFGGLLGSLRGAGATLLGIAGTRFELIGVEVAEEKERLVSLFLLGLAAAFAIFLAVLVLTLFVIAFWWDSHRLVAIAACSAVYAGLGFWLVGRMRACLAAQPPVFAATIAELEKDRAALCQSLQPPPDLPPQA